MMHPVSWRRRTETCGCRASRKSRGAERRLWMMDVSCRNDDRSVRRAFQTRGPERKGFPAFGSARLGSKEPYVPDDVLVLELLEKRYLPNRGGRHALLLLLQPDSFERHDLVRDAVAGLAPPRRSPRRSFHLLEVVHRRGDARRGGGRGADRASTPRARRCAQSEAISVLFAVFFKAKRRARFQTAPTHGDCSQVHNLSASVVDGAPARLPRSNVFWQKQTTLASLAASRLASSRLFGVSLSWAPTPTPSRGSWRPRPRRPPSRSPARRARETGARQLGRRPEPSIRRPSTASSSARATRVRTTRPRASRVVAI